MAPVRVAHPFPAHHLQHRLPCAPAGLIQDSLMPAWPPLQVPWPPKCTLRPTPHSRQGTSAAPPSPHSQGWVRSCAHGRAKLFGGMLRECMHTPGSLGPVLRPGLAGEQREHIPPAD